MSQAKYIKKIDSGDGVRIENGGETDTISFGRKRSRKEKVLVVILLIVLVVAIVFIALYVWQVTMKATTGKEGDQGTSSRTTMSPSTHPSSPKTIATTIPVCGTPDCVLIASGTLAQLICFLLV